MKTYQEFRYSLIESDIRGWDLSLIEKMEEWINLDEETQIKIVNGLIEGDESLIEEWGMLYELKSTAIKKVSSGVANVAKKSGSVFKGFRKRFGAQGFSKPIRRAALKAGIGKKVARFIPGVGTALYGYETLSRAARGDFKGAALAAGSAIPGPIGYGFMAADIAREVSKGDQSKPQPPTSNQKTNTNPNTNPNTNNKLKRQVGTSAAPAARKSYGNQYSRSGKLKLVST